MKNNPLDGNATTAPRQRRKSNSSQVSGDQPTKAFKKRQRKHAANQKKAFYARRAESAPTCEHKVHIMDARVTFINAHKVTEVLKSFHSFKSPGLDNIVPHALKNLGDSAITRLVGIFKASYLLGYVPHKWLASNVKFLPKVGKDSYDKPNSFRPISLMSYLHKALE